MTDGRVLRIRVRKLAGTDRDPSLSVGDQSLPQRSQARERGATRNAPTAGVAATAEGAAGEA